MKDDPRERKPARAGLALLAALLLAAAGGPAAAPVPHADAGADVSVLLGLAESGDARAAFLLGARFASGRGGVRDDSEAVRWFRQAAQGGLAEAQYNLAILYATGRGVEADLAEAARWYRLAGEQGVAQAQYNLGVMYGTGRGVARDPVRAVRWLAPAAAAGLPRAQHNLGVFYEHGRGVGRDIEAAIALYQRAAASGYEPSRSRLEALGRGLTAPEPGDAPTPDDVAAARAREPTTLAAPVASAGTAPTGPGTGPGYLGWVTTLDPELFTIQLISDPREAVVRKFVERHFERGEAGYYSKMRDGTRWYSAIHGAFSTYRQATVAAEALPVALRTGEPWVRRVRVVLESMQQP